VQAEHERQRAALTARVRQADEETALHLKQSDALRVQIDEVRPAGFRPPAPQSTPLYPCNRHACTSSCVVRLHGDDVASPGPAAATSGPPHETRLPACRSAGVVLTAAVDDVTCGCGVLVRM
jgi:hypothetical protein